ncbi:High-affinity choline transporter 1 [Nymphon striatum]|nr:High-affinity choline transporter 1 [Nymphon striatum]
MAEELNIPGIVSLIIFYFLILAVGVWASRKKGKSTNVSGETEDNILAGRNIPAAVGIFTMTATWVGGGYINGSAEVIYTKGLVWCQAPIGYTISLILGGIFFAKPMRSRGYVTMLDPLQEKFGNRIGGLLFIPAVCGEILWCSSILAALGSTMSVILALPFGISVTVSSAIAVLYTLIGGLYSVAYTDVIQLVCIFVGLWLCIPFAMTHAAVKSIDLSVTDWLGSVHISQSGEFVDHYILLIFGGIPWQAYFQRVLSTRSARQSQILSIAAGAGCFILVIPALLAGAIGRATDWTATGYGKEIGKDDVNKVLPLVLQYLTPTAVSFFGLGAVSAAVMSSADSTVLSASSMFTRNVYKLTFRPQASDKELLYVMKIAIIVNGVIATLIALYAVSIYDLFILCGDIVYVILFPQLLSVIHFPKRVNSYGSLSAFFIGFLLRGLLGEKKIGLIPVLKLPFYDDEHGQLFPYRSLVMLVSLTVLVLVSGIVAKCFRSGVVPLKYDFLGDFQRENEIKNQPIEANGNIIVHNSPSSEKNSVEMTKF